MLDKIYNLIVFGVCISYISEKVYGVEFDFKKPPLEISTNAIEIFGKQIIKYKK